MSTEEYVEECNCDQSLSLKDKNERLWKIIKDLKREKNKVKDYNRYLEKQNRRLWDSFSRMMDRARRLKRVNTLNKIL